MANKKISQLTAKGSALAATDLVEISESDGGGGYLTKSVTGANIKSGLQATLVSGTNIKTINSTTLLGSGDIAIGSGVHILTKPISGRTYSVRTTGTGITSSTATSANTIALYPFIPANSLTVSNLQINVTTLAVGGNARILIYSDVNGVPSSKLLESTSLDCSTTGAKTYTASFTFNAGTVYWLGTYSNLAINVSIFSDTQMTPISTGSATLPFTAAFSTATAVAVFPNAPATLGTATLSSSIANLCVINLTAA